MFRLLAPIVLSVGLPAVAAVPQANANLTAMYEADQAARLVKVIDWAKLDIEDARRRARTRALLDAGALGSGDDFFHAAFIFQHGQDPADTLLAHALAMTAMKMGRQDASWIAAASLDRYLMDIGQAQIFGTQYRCRGRQPNMDPYQHALVPDSVRRMLSVPSRPEQEKHGQALCVNAPINSTTK